GYYDFRHQLLRDAIYGDVPPSQLRRYHARAAEFVMNLEASNIMHASRHYERAGLRPQAFQTSLTAAREASRISARHEAFELYQRAVANMPADLPMLMAVLPARDGSPGRDILVATDRALAELADLSPSEELDRERAFLL